MLFSDNIKIEDDFQILNFTTEDIFKYNNSNHLNNHTKSQHNFNTKSQQNGSLGISNEAFHKNNNSNKNKEQNKITSYSSNLFNTHFSNKLNLANKLNQKPQDNKSNTMTQSFPKANGITENKNENKTQAKKPDSNTPQIKEENPEKKKTNSTSTIVNINALDKTNNYDSLENLTINNLNKIINKNENETISKGPFTNNATFIEEQVLSSINKIFSNKNLKTQSKHQLPLIKLGEGNNSSNNYNNKGFFYTKSESKEKEKEKSESKNQKPAIAIPIKSEETHPINLVINNSNDENQGKSIDEYKKNLETHLRIYENYKNEKKSSLEVDRNLNSSCVNSKNIDLKMKDEKCINKKNDKTYSNKNLNMINNKTDSKTDTEKHYEDEPIYKFGEKKMSKQNIIQINLEELELNKTTIIGKDNKVRPSNNIPAIQNIKEERIKFPNNLNFKNNIINYQNAYIREIYKSESSQNNNNNSSSNINQNIYSYAINNLTEENKKDRVEFATKRFKDILLLEGEDGFYLQDKFNELANVTLIYSSEITMNENNRIFHSEEHIKDQIFLDKSKFKYVQLILLRKPNARLSGLNKAMENYFSSYIKRKDELGNFMIKGIISNNFNSLENYFNMNFKSLNNIESVLISVFLYKYDIFFDYNEDFDRTNLNREDMRQLVQNYRLLKFVRESIMKSDNHQDSVENTPKRK